jgi:hypothetical protein
MDCCNDVFHARTAQMTSYVSGTGLSGVLSHWVPFPVGVIDLVFPNKNSAGFSGILVRCTSISIASKVIYIQ